MATSVPPRTDRASSISSGRLSARIEQKTHAVSRSGQPRQEVADAGEIVGAVPDLERLLAAALEPAGERHVLRRVRVDVAPEERLGRGGREREVAAPATTTRRRRSRARAAPTRASPSTTVAPGCTTASFSAAIASRVSPSTSMWSSATFVSTTTRVRRTFVASWRPPSPASTTATSTSLSANASSAAAVSDLELRRVAGVRAHARDRLARSPPRGRRRGSARSSRACAATDRRRPRGPASASSASVIRVVVDLPFVPTTWIAG